MKKERRLLNKKMVSGLLISSMLLSACSCAKRKDPEPIVIVKTVVVTATPAPTPTNAPTPVPTPTSVPTPTPVPTEETEEEETEVEETSRKETTETTEYHSADGGIDAFWDSIYNKINKINRKIDDIDYQKIKDTTKAYAKSLIDFIFYGGTIGGKTFDELKSDIKEETFAKLQKIDSYIMKDEPNYKEKLGQKYNLVKDFSKTTLKKAKDIFNSHIQININPTSKPKKKTLKKKKSK